MGDTMLLERVEEALAAPPAYELPVVKDPTAVDELREQARLIVKNGEEWLDRLTRSVAKARKHPLHRQNFGEVWAHLEPTLSRAILARENGVRQIDAVINRASDLKGKDADQITGYAKKISRHIAKEQRALVDLYYLLKADADESAEDTRGTESTLSTPDDVRAYFKRIRAA